MDAKYVFDSNIFIGLQRRQPMDIYPSVWEKISDLMKNGIVISSREVFDELSASGDELTKWAKARQDSFLPTTTDIQLRARKILAEHRELVEGGKKKNNADPFVIALAQERGCAVVTDEAMSNSLSAPKIPNICVIYNIRQIDLVAFLREMQISF
jgi:hypothetical protein